MTYSIHQDGNFYLRIGPVEIARVDRLWMEARLPSEWDSSPWDVVARSHWELIVFGRRWL